MSLTLSDKVIANFQQEVESISCRQKKNRIFQIVSKFEELKSHLTDCKSTNILTEPWFFLADCDDCTFDKESIDSTIIALDEKMSSAMKPFVESTFVCECGSKISVTAKPKHFNSAKHKRFMGVVQLKDDLEEYKGKYAEMMRKLHRCVEREEEEAGKEGLGEKEEEEEEEEEDVGEKEGLGEKDAEEAKADEDHKSLDAAEEAAFAVQEELAFAEAFAEAFIQECEKDEREQEEII